MLFIKECAINKIHPETYSLYDTKNRNGKKKLWLTYFMPEEKHSYKTAQSASDTGYKKQRLLWNPKRMFHRPFLICPVQYKGKKIYEPEIKNNTVHTCISSWSVKE